jgi:AcrR family transcriptional regulator
MKSRSYTMVARVTSVDETRQRILAAARTLFFEQWYEDVTLAGIAEAAKVSHQTVLNHFGSKDGVFASLAEVVEAETGDRKAAASRGGTAAALDLLLEQYEAAGLANARLVMQEHRSGAVHDVLERARARHRAWVEEVWADHLPPSGPARRQKVAALLAATEVMAWKAIRHDYGFSRRDTAAAIHAVVAGLEAQP